MYNILITINNRSNLNTNTNNKYKKDKNNTQSNIWNKIAKHVII